MSNLGKFIGKLNNSTFGGLVHQKIHRKIADDDSPMGKLAGLNLLAKRKMNPVAKNTMQQAAKTKTLLGG